MVMLLSALKYITLKVVKNMTVFMSLILILLSALKHSTLKEVKYDRFYVIDFNFAKAYRNGPSSIFKSPLLVQTDSDFDMAYLYGLAK